MSEHRVNPELMHRTTWGNPLWNALQNLNIYGMCLAGSLVVSFFLAACITGRPAVHADNCSDIQPETVAQSPSYAHDAQVRRSLSGQDDQAKSL